MAFATSHMQNLHMWSQFLIILGIFLRCESPLNCFLIFFLTYGYLWYMLRSCVYCIYATYFSTLPYRTFGVGRLLHLPSAEAVSVRPNAQPRCNQKVTVIGCEAETSAVKPKSAVKPNKSPATWDWWRVVWLFLSGGLHLVSSSPSD